MRHASTSNSPAVRRWAAMLPGSSTLNARAPFIGRAAISAALRSLGLRLASSIGGDLRQGFLAHGLTVWTFPAVRPAAKAPPP